MNETNVLLIEDDHEVADVIGTALRRDGFSVTAVHEGGAALDAFSDVQPDVVLLDLVLPTVPGLEVCRELRRRSLVPIIVISGRGGEGDVVAALEAGADDYLVKPFGIPELVARIRAARRRRPTTAAPTANMLELDDLCLDPASQRAWFDGRHLDLPVKEFHVLLVLVRNAGRVVSRAGLVSEVWGVERGVSNKAVDARIRRLREKIEADPARPQRIVTVRGVGFRYEPAAN